MLGRFAPTSTPKDQWNRGSTATLGRMQKSVENRERRQQTLSSFPPAAAKSVRPHAASVDPNDAGIGRSGQQRTIRFRKHMQRVATAFIEARVGGPGCLRRVRESRHVGNLAANSHRRDIILGFARATPTDPPKLDSSEQN
jgi:hypothetical protein